ncbi:MAG TPA: BlaI/MecI/CopY family transcriptional regulator [Pirellulales bacterium]|nr:BlaI/MecI/CopY family transcriptional regulator [Pirellulales bacterium]
MARPRQDVTPAELAILELLWDRAKASTRQIVDALDPGGGAGRYATVQKQLERMEAKGLILRDRSYFQHLFSPAVDREELAGQRLRTVLDKLCEGSLVPLLSHIVRTRPLTPDEREALRELIDQPNERKRSTPRKPKKE